MSNENIDDEISKIRDEMNEIKEMLKEKKEESKSKGRSRRRFVFDGDAPNVDFGDLGATMDGYIENVLSGVQTNLARSMEGLAASFAGLNVHKHAARDAKRAAKRAAREARHMGRRFKEKVVYAPLSEEELEEFYSKGPILATALSDVRRLQILKLLEESAKYPADFSESLSFTGGTLKHHLDNLIDVGFIIQEKVRGRYLITQLGMEGLKLVEILFRRSRQDVDPEFHGEDDEEETEVKIEFDEDDVEEVEELEE